MKIGNTSKIKYSPLNIKRFFEQKQIHKSLPPEALVYTGHYIDEVFHGEIYTYNTKEYQKIDFHTVDDIKTILIENQKSDRKITWINVVGLNDTEAISALGHLLEIPKLYLEDIVHISKHSKYNMDHKMIFNVMQMIYFKGKEISHENVSILFKNDVIVTFQETKGDVFDSIRERIINRSGTIRERKGDYLYYCLIDALVDNYMEVLRFLNFTTDHLEDSIIENEEFNLEEIHTVRKQLLRLKTTIFPLQKLVVYIKTNDIDGLAQEIYPYLDDVNEHIEQLSNEINMQREIINNLFETHMLNVSNDMNQVMTTLTIFSAVFIPLSFLAGVFGMNFSYIPGLNNGYGFFAFMAVCIVLAITMVIFFKRKKWF